MQRRIGLFIGLLMLAGLTLSQPLTRPKLVVGIVVDQMKFDYIYRYWDKLGEGGFKRLVKDGYEFSNAKYNYAPTYTGPGHASIYTGTTPCNHGIISNDWYNRDKHKNVYCVEDGAANTIGAEGSAGNMSPRNLLVNTITDELKLSTNFKSKVIGIALKDRGAILPAGHTADGAFWFDNKSGKMVTSDYYMTTLPSWVNDFNSLKYAQKYSKETWNTLYDISKYTESTTDSNAYESTYKGEKAPTFPHVFSTFGTKDFENVRRSPFGNTLTKDFAKAAIIGEQLGVDNVTDMLCVSFSSTDYIGHQFGTNAIETEDCYLRLDKDLEDFLMFIDQKIGKKNVLIFLTADHGAVQNPQFLIDNKLNAGFFDPKIVERTAKSFLFREYQDSSFFETLGDQCIYLDQDAIKAKKIDIELLTKGLGQELLKMPEITEVSSASALIQQPVTGRGMQLAKMSFNITRSGDLYYTLAPNFIEGTNKKGTTHGAPFNYDTHIPLFFYGFNIASGSSILPVYINDIAPTISSILKIEFPNASTGNPLNLPTLK